jgi:carboxymethylenebutenolidase
MGGGYAYLAATSDVPVDAAVAFYGGGIVRGRDGMALEPILDEADAIDAPLLCLFGSEDGGIPQADVEAIRRRLGVGCEVHVYQGAKHAFMNDRRANFHPEAARDAWARTLDWFGRYL